MKKTILPALIISIVVMAIAAYLIIILEPSKATVPYYHEKTLDEIVNYLTNLKDEEGKLLFNDLEEVDETTLKYIVGIEPAYLEDYSVKVSTTDATLFLVLKLKEGSKSIIEDSVITYMDYIENEWIDIDATQAELVGNYCKISMENNLIYVVSKNNEYVKESINSLFIYADKK